MDLHGLQNEFLEERSRNLTELVSGLGEEDIQKIER